MTAVRIDPATRQNSLLLGGGAGKTWRLRLLVALLVPLVALGLASARPAQAADQVPFSGTFTTAGFTVTPCGPATFCLDPHGAGEATHLGRTTFTRFIVTTNTFAPCTDVPNGTIRQFTDTLTLTAANGATLTMSGSGTSCANGVDVVSTGNYSVTDGTGRFEGASGTVTLAISRFAPDPEITTLAGTISSPGSLR